MLVSKQYPYCEIVISIGTWNFGEEAYLDTGFEGGLLIPEYLHREILASPTWSRLRVAHDALVDARTWMGTIEIGDLRAVVEIAAMGSRFLLGREVMDRLLICFDRGKEVRIEM